MIKSKLLIFILIIFISCNSHKKTDLKSFDLKGNVYRVNYIYKNASEKFGKVVEGEIVLDSLTTLTFNEKGQLIDSTWNNGKYSKKFEYKNNLIKQESLFFKNKMTSYTIYSYTDKNQLNEINKYDGTKNISHKKIYKNIENFSDVKVYNSDGNLIANEKLNYDDENNLIKIITLNSKTTFKYDDNIMREKVMTKSKIIEENCIDSDDFKYSAKLKYEQRITRRSTYDKNGNISTYNLNAYNDIETLSEDCKSYGWSDGFSTATKFSYTGSDKFKNWTKQIIKKEWGVSSLIERKIYYFKNK
jgi:hypothetical protein